MRKLLARALILVSAFVMTTGVVDAGAMTNSGSVWAFSKDGVRSPIRSF
jgi:hypothetical protein